MNQGIINIDHTYKKLLKYIKDYGIEKEDRTNTGTISTFSPPEIAVHLTDYILPVLTTKKIFLKGIIHELLWMLQGSTNVEYLQRNGVHIWDDWIKVKGYDLFIQLEENEYANKLGEILTKVYLNLKTDEAKAVDRYVSNNKGKFPDYIYKQALLLAVAEGVIPKVNLDKIKQIGELGPVYGAQWRNWENIETAKTGVNSSKFWERIDLVGRFDLTVVYARYIDQIKRLEYELVHNPFSRRHILTAWNVGKIDRMQLPPCHTLAQFYVSEIDGQKELSCKLYARSQDVFLGTPFNITFYCLLTMLLCKVHGFKPGKYVHSFGDAHIYSNHETQVNEQLSREPKYLPIQMDLKNNPKSILEIGYEDIVLTGYTNYLKECHPPIKAPIAV